MDQGFLDGAPEYYFARLHAYYEFLSNLPDAEYWEMLVDCDLYIVSQRTKLPAVFFPSKMLPAIAVGCPVLVLADRECELAQFVEQHDLGKVWNPPMRVRNPW